MTETQFNCLAFLRSQRATPPSAGCVGAHLWPDRDGAIVAAHGGGDYQAQMYLGRLRRLGWVRTLSTGGSSAWGLTADGHNALLDEEHRRARRAS